MESKERRRLHHCAVQDRSGPRILGAAVAYARGAETGSAEDAARTADSSGVAGQSTALSGKAARRSFGFAGCMFVLRLAACERPHEPEPPPLRGKQVFHLNAYAKDYGTSHAALIDKTKDIYGSVAADQSTRLVAPGA